MRLDVVTSKRMGLHDVTSSMIESTSGLLRDQAAIVEEQATQPGVDMASLQRAWDNVFAALDQIDTYKLRALEAMKVTVTELTQQVDRSHSHVERLHAGEPPADAAVSARPAASSLQLP